MNQFIGSLGSLAIYLEIFITHAIKKYRYAEGIFDIEMQESVTSYFIEYTKVASLK